MRFLGITNITVQVFHTIATGAPLRWGESPGASAFLDYRQVHVSTFHFGHAFFTIFHSVNLSGLRG
jgi:hypothetical protein